MNIIITNLYNNAELKFTGDAETVLQQIIAKYPWAAAKGLRETLERINNAQAYAVNIER